MMDPRTLEALHAARAAEKEQALYYGALAARADAAGDVETAERLNGLHADEQHHLSRLTARLIELGEDLAELREVAIPPASLEEWEEAARKREAAEIERYQHLLDLPLDSETRTRVSEIVEVERMHLETLGGKWTLASPRGGKEDTEGAGEGETDNGGVGDGSAGEVTGAERGE